MLKKTLATQKVKSFQSMRRRMLEMICPLLHVMFSITLQFTLFEVQRQHLKENVHHSQSLKSCLWKTSLKPLPKLHKCC